MLCIHGQVSSDLQRCIWSLEQHQEWPLSTKGGVNPENLPFYSKHESDEIITNQIRRTDVKLIQENSKGILEYL